MYYIGLLIANQEEDPDLAQETEEEDTTLDQAHIIEENTWVEDRDPDLHTVVVEEEMTEEMTADPEISWEKESALAVERKVISREIVLVWAVQDQDLDTEREVETGTEITEKEVVASREENKEEVLHPQDLSREEEGAAQEDHQKDRIEKFVWLMVKLKVKDKEKIKETILIRKMCLIIKV